MPLFSQPGTELIKIDRKDEVGGTNADPCQHRRRAGDLPAGLFSNAAGEIRIIMYRHIAPHLFGFDNDIGTILGNQPWLCNAK
jgi:hypothetical protein